MLSCVVKINLSLLKNSSNSLDRKEHCNNVLSMLLTNFVASHFNMDGRKGTVTDVHKVGFKDTEAFKVAKGNRV